MSGTIVNVVAVLLGSAIGLLVGNRLTQKMQETVVTGLGFVTFVIAIQNAMASGNIIIPLLSVAVGAVIGEALDIDGALKRLGGWLEGRTTPNKAAASADEAAQARIRFITGFVTATLLFEIGPLTILGAVKNGLNGDAQLLMIKSALDFFASMAFSASLGIGVAFSVLPMIVVQGGLALVGMLFSGVVSAGATSALSQNPYVRELTGTGGILLIGLALVLTNLKQPRVANFLPALIIAPLLVGLGALLHIAIYPL